MSPRRLLLLPLALVALAPATRAQSATDTLGAAAETVLPLRSVREAAALAPGIHRDLATGALVFRSREGREPTFVVDGVRRLGGPLGASTLSLLGAAEVPFSAVARVEALAGFVPANVGEAGGGVVAVETAAGASRFGAQLEALSSEATDAFGYSLGSATVRAPLGRLGGVSLTGEFRRLGDAVPSAGESVRLTEAAYAAFQANPQVLRVTDAGGAVRFVPFPADAAQAAFAAGQPFMSDDVRAALGLPAGSQLDASPIMATDVLTEADVERVRAQDDPLRDLSLYGQAELSPTAALRLRLGGGLFRRTAEATAPTPAEAFGRRFANRDALSEQTAEGAAGFGRLEARLSPAVTAFARASAERTGSTLHPSAFSSDVADALLYGDSETSAAAQRYVASFGGSAVRQYFPIYDTDSGARPLPRSSTGFAQPGAVASFYDRQSAASVQLGAGVEARLGRHRLEAGAEAERLTFRRFTLDGFRLASFAADADGGLPVGTAFPNGVTRYDQFDFSTLQFRASTYGYSFNGLEPTDDQDVDAYFPDAAGRRLDTSVAPFRPLTAAGYVRDRVAVGPVALDLGLRLEAYDARTTTLLDPYAPTPILRARDLASAPAGIGDDFAVYYAGDQVVGFRDLGGQFFDATGAAASETLILQERRGMVRADADAPISEAFVPTQATVRLQPRLAVRVRATDAVALTGYAMRASRRPDPGLFVPFTAYEALSGASVLSGSAALRPEDVLAAGIGAEAKAAPGLTLAAEAFARQTRHLPVQTRFNAGFPSYAGVADTGRRDETGLDLSASLARTRGVAVQAAYTFTSVRTERASVSQSFTFVPPVAVSDARHEIDVAVDARVPAGAGPRLGGVAPFGGLGLGVVVAAQSGLPYTALEANTGFSVLDPFTPAVRGELDGSRLPWTSEVDVRLERRFDLGSAGLTAFAWVENLLGTRNTLALFRSTGEPDADGFAATPAGQNVLDTPGERLGYAGYVGGPVNVGGRQSTEAPFVYGQPRQVRLGVRLGF